MSNTTKKNIYIIIFILALIGVIFVLLNMYKEEKDKKEEQISLIESANDTIQFWKTKEGKNAAKISVLETMSSKTFLAFQSQDETIRELQKLVKDNNKLFKNSKGSASIIKSETNIDATGATTVTPGANGDPIYSANISNEWYNIKTIASKDTTLVNLKTTHSLKLVMGEESQGFWKPKKTFATAFDENPYSNITDMRIYNVTSNTKRFAVGPNVGGSALFYDGNVKIGWSVGVGVTYSLIRF